MTLYTERAIILYLKYIQNYYFETYILLSNIYRLTHIDVNFGTFTQFVISLCSRFLNTISLKYHWRGGAHGLAPRSSLAILLGTTGPCELDPWKPRPILAWRITGRGIGLVAPALISYMPVPPSLSFPLGWWKLVSRSPDRPSPGLRLT